MSRPRHIAAKAGQTYTLGRLTLAFKVSAVDNDGAYTLVEVIEPPGSGAGLHRHSTYDETHIICEGHYECRLGEETLKLGPGEIMVAPRGTPHSIKSLGPETGRELIVSSPGGIFDGFIAEVSGAMAGGVAVDFKGIAAKYGIEFLE